MYKMVCVCVCVSVSQCRTARAGSSGRESVCSPLQYCASFSAGKKTQEWFSLHLIFLFQGAAQGRRALYGIVVYGIVVYDIVVYGSICFQSQAKVRQN